MTHSEMQLRTSASRIRSLNICVELISNPFFQDVHTHTHEPGRPWKVFHGISSIKGKFGQVFGSWCEMAKLQRCNEQWSTWNEWRKVRPRDGHQVTFAGHTTNSTPSPLETPYISRCEHTVASNAPQLLEESNKSQTCLI